MIFYHGTNLIINELLPGTWLAESIHHAYRLAERRTKQRGGNIVVLEIETINIDRVEGRKYPSYLFSGGEHKIVATHRMLREVIE